MLARKYTLGQLFLLALYLWYAFPAFSMGFSVLPPPATWPIMARHVLGITYTRILALNHCAGSLSMSGCNKIQFTAIQLA